MGFWAVLGAGAQHFLDDEKRLQIFNRMMGAILCVVATYLFLKYKLIRSNCFEVFYFDQERPL